MPQKLINEKLEKRLDDMPGGYSKLYCVGLKSRMYGALGKTIIDAMQTDNIVFAFLLMLYTCLCIGEALGLQTGDIDLDKAELTVRRSMNYVQLPNTTEWIEYICGIKVGLCKTEADKGLYTAIN